MNPLIPFPVGAAGGGSGGSGDVVGPVSSTEDNIAVFADASGTLLADSGIDYNTVVVNAGTATDMTVARFDGATGQLIEDSGVTISDTDVVSGATQLNVDNIRIDGNVISSTNANGNVTVTPNGTGSLELPFGSATSPSLKLADSRGFYGGNGALIFVNSLGTKYLSANSSGVGASIGSDGQYLFSAITDAASTPDTGLARAAAGVIQATDGSTGIGALLSSTLVEANTAGSGAPNVLAANESGKVLTNEGSTAENYHTLPSAVAGYQFTFVVQDSDGIRITAAGGDTIQPIAGTAASAAGGFIRCATLGAFITLVAINATEWVAIGSAGVWTIDA